MQQADLVITNAEVFAEGATFRGGVAIRDEVIVSMGQGDSLPDGKRTIDAGGKLLLPGCIEPHIHIREPGRPDRGTFKTETMAAVAGGVTTILEHPIAKPPQYAPEILHRRIADAEPQCLTDFAFYGAAGAQFPDEIARMAKEGIVAFKTFLHAAPEGRDEEFAGLTMANDGEMYRGFREVAKTGILCAVHAENNDIISGLIASLRAQGRVDPMAHCLSRPPLAEYETVAKLLYFARDCGVRLIFCHISTPEAMALVRDAKREGLEVYLETCPQYLLLTEDALKQHGPYAKCNPALRPKEQVDALWEFVGDGSVDFIGSDHATYTVAEKETGLEDIFKAPAGFPGVDLRLPLLLDSVHKGRVDLGRAVELLCGNVAKVFGLSPRKGAIRVGADGDLVLVDMDRTFTVDRNKNYSKSREIARVFDGWELRGLPVCTVVRGRVVMEDGLVDEGAAGWGKLIKPVQGK